MAAQLAAAQRAAQQAAAEAARYQQEAAAAARRVHRPSELSHFMWLFPALGSTVGGKQSQLLWPDSTVGARAVVAAAVLSCVWSPNAVVSCVCRLPQKQRRAGRQRKRPVRPGPLPHNAPPLLHSNSNSGSSSSNNNSRCLICT